jgi:hypothetical protein
MTTTTTTPPFYLGAFSKTRQDTYAAQFTLRARNKQWNLTAQYVINSGSMLDCASYCLSYTQCTAYSFNEATGECRPVAFTTSANAAQMQSASGHSVFEIV